MISEEVVVELATVQVNNDYRVELHQFRRTVDYSPAQARQLAQELTLAANQAQQRLVGYIEGVESRATDSQPRTISGEAVF
jgi:hypothetical protein